MFLIIGFIFGIVVCKYDLINLKSLENGETNDSRFGSSDVVNEVLQKLKTDFKNQSKPFFSNIISCYEHSVIKGQDPSIILLVSNKEMLINTNCVAERLLKRLTHKFDVNIDNLVIDAEKFIGSTQNDVKKILDDKLTHTFGKLNEKLALIKNIQYLPGNSLLLFHGYGDDVSSAKYPGVVIFLTFTYEDDLSDNKPMSGKQLTQFIEKKITEKFSEHISYDQLKPLFTRITNNIVKVNYENSC